MSLDALALAAERAHLAVMGVADLAPEDGFGTGALALLGPDEPGGFWPAFTDSPEFRDGAPDPMDRWSRRVIDALAEDLGGHAAYPFGTPLRPFMTWALRSGRAWSSPVGILVHDQAGLWVSFRGAVILPGVAAPSSDSARPCDTCEGQPCLTACPVSALTGDGYNLAACHGYLDTPPGRSCLSRGCEVRRACPQGASWRRLDAQSTFHMRHFHR